jgi:hypothetical protein
MRALHSPMLIPVATLATKIKIIQNFKFIILFGIIISVNKWVIVCIYRYIILICYEFMTVVQDNYNYTIIYYVNIVMCWCTIFVLNVQILLCMIFFLLFLFNILYVTCLVIITRIVKWYLFFSTKKVVIGHQPKIEKLKILHIDPQGLLLYVKYYTRYYIICIYYVDILYTIILIIQ